GFDVQKHLSAQLAAQGYEEAAKAVQAAKTSGVTSARALEETFKKAVGKDVPTQVLSEITKFTTGEKLLNEAGAFTVDKFAKTKLGAMGQGFVRGATKSAPLGAAYGASEALQNDEDIG